MKRIILALALVAASAFSWRKIGAGLLPIALMSALVVVGSTSAQAVEGKDSPCVAADAYTETVTEAYDETVVVSEERVITVVDSEAFIQRYSWTGGPHAEDEPPAFPSSAWQPNVKGDPHQIGQPGAYFRSNGNNGNGDWFYLDFVAAVTHTETIAAVTRVDSYEAVTVDHPAVVCDPTDQVIAAFATPPVNDACGVGNASWILSGDTSNDFSWDLTDAGALSAIAHSGFVFDNGESVIEFGLAPESNTNACPVVVVDSVDFCPNIAGDQPSETDCTPPKEVLVCDAGGPAPTIANCHNAAPKTVVAESPTADPATCENNGRLILPTTDNVTYVSTPAGTGPGVHTVTATAGSGFKMFGTSVFTIMARQLPTSDCVEPIVKGISATIVEPQILPAVLAGESTSLPDTGGISLWLLLLAGPMTVAGLLVVMRNRPVTHAFAGGYGPRYSLTSPLLAKAVAVASATAPATAEMAETVETVEIAQTGFRRAVSRVVVAFGSLFGGRR